jgi:REP element-mobilizing transposase RayT
MSNYRRHYVPGGTWFFTVNLQNRQSDLLTRHIDSLRAATSTVKRANPSPLTPGLFCLNICTVSGPTGRRQ